jgi:hypothetical protein
VADKAEIPDEQEIRVHPDVLLQDMGRWYPVPGTDLEVRIMPMDEMGTIRVRKAPDHG